MKAQIGRLIGGLMMLLLAGCGLNEASPTLPPPPTSVENRPPALVVTGQPTAVAPEMETAVAESSPTPIETPTLAPTATPGLEPADPQSQPVTAGDLPAVSHDLLFLAEGSLKLWDHDASRLETLVAGTDETGGVLDYALNGNGRQAAVLRLTQSTAISLTAPGLTTTLHTYELSSLNLETGQQRPLLPALRDWQPPDFALSPDGRHLAFGALSLASSSETVPNPDSLSSLFVVPLDGSIAPKNLGSCAGRCRGFVWHPDNNFFVFADDDGLWLYNLAASRPEPLLTGGGSAEASPRLEPISWARNGRWLLAWSTTGSEGAEQAIFDVPTKLLLPIPHTFRYADALYAELTWMQDDRLFMVRTEGDTAVGETWRINLDAGELQRDESVALSTEVDHPIAPVHWADGRFGYGLIDVGGGEGTGLYRRVAFNEPAERLNAIPAARLAPEVAWLPDGSGAAMAQQGRLYVAPADGALYDLGTAVGPQAHHLTWLP